MSNKEIIKKYLEEASANDPALAEKFDASKMDDCLEAIQKNAKKIATKSCAMIKSDVVFKWARDFFIDGKCEKPNKDDNEIDSVEEVKNKPMEKNAVSEDYKKELKAEARREVLEEIRKAEEAKRKAEAEKEEAKRKAEAEKRAAEEAKRKAEEEKRKAIEGEQTILF